MCWQGVLFALFSFGGPPPAFLDPQLFSVAWNKRKHGAHYSYLKGISQGWKSCPYTLGAVGSFSFLDVLHITAFHDVDSKETFFIRTNYIKRHCIICSQDGNS